MTRRSALALTAAAGVAATTSTGVARAATPSTGAPAATDGRPTDRKSAKAPRSLQEITDAWGRWMAQSQFPQSGGCRWTESTDYGRKSELRNYHRHQVATDYTGIAYDAGAPSPVPGEVTSVVTNYRNGTDLEQMVTYRQGLTTQQTFRISVTESLSIGVTTTVEATIPAVASVGSSTTIQTNLSATQEFTHSTSQNWNVDLPLRIPPLSMVEAALVVGTQQYDIDWTARVALTGRVAVWFNNKVDLNHDGDLHWLWFPQIQDVFNAVRANGLIDLHGYEIFDGGVNARAAGTFSGGQGVSISVNTEQTPLKRGAAAAVTRRIPLRTDGTPAAVPAN
ncbi:cytotoxin leucocidin [Streptomyces pathocidini]|uniref:Cytotoxin leucocidin n=1 Tax=Streptomyces pathocidini TaxID=1650571 RepID=A0ABW7UJL1_9ACTN|nr:cytotoxin leucocidin [Streptomyces pathocidini]